MNNWKQMSEQAQSEWLAGFCGWTYYPKREGEINCDAHWERPDNLRSPLYTFDGGNHLQDFFNSPTGFMAVWDRLEEKFGYGLRLEFNLVTDGRYTCYVCKHIEHKEYCGAGNSRQEAFYESVYKAVNDD
jgi:hypothetical protein